MRTTYIAKREAVSRAAVMIADAFQICGARRVSYGGNRVFAVTHDGVHLTVMITAPRAQ